VLEDAGAQSVPWATGISPGPARETNQGVSFTVTTDNPALFAQRPAVAADGTLTYAPAANANGTATVSVTARDDGGTANGGSDTSVPSSFTIAVSAVNDAPTCSVGGNQTVISLLGKQVVPGFVSATPGPADESSQSVSYVATTDKPGLFLVPPTIAPNGTLTYTPRLLGLGVATVTVRAVDNGGTANGGADTSAPVTFTITVI
jgi:large repetitive protein